MSKAKQDEWKRITLRLPPELYDALWSRARIGSLNAEIVSRLEASVAGEIGDFATLPPEKQRLLLKIAGVM